MRLGRPVVAGYHGTTDVHARAILAQGFAPSVGNGHWLGAPLAYFFEDEDLAAGWAEHWALPRHGGEIAVLRAKLDLVGCLDLTKLTYRRRLAAAGRAFLRELPPEAASRLTQDHGRRELDSLVLSAAVTGAGGEPPFRSVRAICAARHGNQPLRVYPPAGELYQVGEKKSWFDLHDHIQIGVADPTAILSVARTRA
jgi:hypothetical protein